MSTEGRKTVTVQRAQPLPEAVTPRGIYDRRKILAGLGAAGFLLAARRPLAAAAAAAGPVGGGVPLGELHKWEGSTDEAVTPIGDVTTYNNFYEFGTGKADPARNAQGLRISPWSVSVEGEVMKPRRFAIEEILRLAPLEERIYRHRCVEGWSVVVPWIGYPLGRLLELVEPMPTARFVAFETLYDPKQMPLGRRAGIPLPYVEGLRLDEAMHPLTLLTTGMYGQTLPKQDGAPVRLVVPWKYGFKSIKSIVAIRLVSNQPPTTWNLSTPEEYGFYSNVNPEVDHPRWSQRTERRLGEFFRRKTLMFNGYAAEVSGLYAGMDLRRQY
jgi:sulfoxide reductase catalytic subunit YedY